MSGVSAYGPSPFAPTSTNPAVTTIGLTRGTGVGTGGTAAANAWGGSTWGTFTDIADAITADATVTFSITPSNGVPVSIDSIDSYNLRRSSSGPSMVQWQYKLGAGAFVDIETPIDLTVSSSGGNILPSLDLTGITDLNSVADGTTVTFRMVNWNASGTGTWYIQNFQTGDDFVVNGTVNPGGPDITPPTVSSRSPENDATDVTLDSVTQLTLNFTEEVGPGTGNITVHKVSDNSVVNTIDVSSFDFLTLNVTEVGLIMENPLEAGIGYYVLIPSGAIVDVASNPFAGFSLPSEWTFTTAAPAGDPTVVINKYLNASPDRVELLVIGSGVPTESLDMREMVFKDFSSNTTGDGGGKFTMTTDALWEAVPVGTLITLSKSALSPDTDDSDFTLSLGLDDPTYFTASGGTFDISTTDMVMIKEAGSDVAGTTGGIHAMSGAASPLGGTSLFTTFTGAKLFADGATGTNLGAVALNSGSVIGDFTGTDAIGGQSLSGSNFGVPNSGTNAGYIAALRGLVLGDGDGVAVVTNATVGSDFENRSFFDAGQPGQSLTVTLTATIPSATITTAHVTIPGSLGVPGGVTLSGTAAAGAGFVINGSTVEISSAAITTADSLVVTISGLSTPTPSLATDNGNYDLTVTTSASGGTLTSIASQPAARVIIPISSLRDVDANGVSPDLGAVVVVRGTVTEEDFGSGVSNFSSFIQDAGAGINVFSPTLDLGLVRANEYAILGTVTQFNGLTEIVVSSADNVVDLGASTEVLAEVVTLDTLLANPEAYEGKLIKVNNLSYVSGSWGSASTVVVQDSTPTTIDIRIQGGSDATVPPTYPANITGILGQFDGSNPFTTGYQIMPRDAADLEAGTASPYDIWAAETGAVLGMSGDDDFDGKDNEFEYAFGLVPTSGSSVDPFTVPFDKATGMFTFTRRTQSLTGLDYKVFTSTTLNGGWAEDAGASLDVVDTVGNVETVEVTLSAGLLAAPKLFIQVVAE